MTLFAKTSLRLGLIIGVAACLAVPVVLLMQEAVWPSENQVSEIDRLVLASIREQREVSECARIEDVWRIANTGGRKEGHFQYRVRARDTWTKVFVTWMIKDDAISIESIRFQDE